VRSVAGNPVFDRVHTDVTVLNATAAGRKQQRTPAATGRWKRRRSTTTSANGLSVTTRQDVTGALSGGNPVFDRTRTDVTALNADGSKTGRVIRYQRGRHDTGSEVTTTSSDRRHHDRSR